MAIANVIGEQLAGRLRQVGRREAPQTLAKGPARLALARDVRAIAAARPATSQQAQAAYRAANQALVGKYPTLDKVLADPDKFMADIKRRFAAQRQLDPKHPYRFAFGDYGVPVMKSWIPMLQAEIAKVEGQLAARGPWTPWRAGSVAERQQTVAHLKDLQAEVQRHLASGKIDYQRLLELGFFVSRAMGRDDLGKLNWRDRAMLVVDRVLQGHRDSTIAAERARFKAGEMKVFEAGSPVAGFKAAQAPFERAYLNPEKLEMITLPSSEELGTDVFMRLSNHNIFLVGVTQQPIAADGFVRPSADFWLHDVRHNSAIFDKHKAYEARHGLTPATAERLSKQIDVWRQELAAAEAQLPDPELARAVRFFSFNFHHDRGYPMVPSSFTHGPENPESIARLLYRTLKLANQRMEDDINVFAAPRATIHKAYEFLHGFWSARLPQERALLGPAAKL